MPFIPLCQEAAFHTLHIYSLLIGGGGAGQSALDVCPVDLSDVERDLPGASHTWEHISGQDGSGHYRCEAGMLKTSKQRQLSPSLSCTGHPALLWQRCVPACPPGARPCWPPHRVDGLVNLHAEPRRCNMERQHWILSVPGSVPGSAGDPTAPFPGLA